MSFVVKLTMNSAQKTPLTRLFSAAGVDYDQWRALARAYTLIDYAAILGAYGHAASMKAARHLLYYVLTWTIIGSGSALYILLFSDAWLSATIMTTTTAMLVAFIVLAQAGNLVAPDDYEIVGFRPVSPSRTPCCAVRATALLPQMRRRWRSSRGICLLSPISDAPEGRGDRPSPPRSPLPRRPSRRRSG